MMDSTLLIKRREAIVLAAIDAIDECGVQSISTRDIAKKQGVSESIIFKHFSTKNDLLLAVLEYFSKYDTAIMETTELREMNPLESITHFFDSYSAYYENYPAITAITQSYDVLRHSPELSSKVKEIFNQHEAFVKTKIEEAVKKGMIETDAEPECLADVMLGTFMRLCLKWRMNGYGFSLRQKTNLAIQKVLKSVAH